MAPFSLLVRKRCKEGRRRSEGCLKKKREPRPLLQRGRSGEGMKRRGKDHLHSQFLQKKEGKTET